MLNRLFCSYFSVVRTRKRWDEAEKLVVLKSFKKNIKEKRFPSKAVIDNFIENNSNIFLKKDFNRIRNLIVNEYNGR